MAECDSTGPMVSTRVRLVGDVAVTSPILHPTDLVFPHIGTSVDVGWQT